MKIQFIDVKKEKNFNRVSKLYKASFDKRERIKTKDFHKYAFKENICFKSCYLDNKFIGFFKGFITDKILYISWFAVINNNIENKKIIINEIKKQYQHLNIIFVLRPSEEISFYEKCGFKLPLVKPKFSNNGINFVCTKNNKFNDYEVADGIRKYDWPLMFKSPDSAEIYYSDVSNLDYKKYYDLLPKKRKERIDKYKFEEDKKLSCGAWVLLSIALKKHKINISKYEIEYEKNGKPCLKNCDYNFSISHSGNYVAVAISKKSIGIDIERIKPFEEKMIKHIFNDLDLDNFNNSKNKNYAFYQTWTYKESILKLTGEGLNNNLKDLKISYYFKFANGLFLYDFDDIRNYKLSICSCIYNVKTPIQIKL